MRDSLLEPEPVGRREGVSPSLTVEVDPMEDPKEVSEHDDVEPMDAESGVEGLLPS